MDQLKGAQAARAVRSMACALLATCALGGAPGPAQSGQIVATARCWYVVPETVVPVNLNDVAVVSSMAADPALQKLSFVHIAKPMKVITEFEVDPDRLHELQEAIARRRSECAARPLT